MVTPERTYRDCTYFCVLAYFYSVRVHYVLKHVVDRSLGRVAFSVVSPSSCLVLRSGRRAVGQTAAQRLVAVGVCPFFVIRVEMGVGQVENFELRHRFLKHFPIRAHDFQTRDDRWCKTEKFEFAIIKRVRNYNIDRRVAYSSITILFAFK